MPSSNRGKTERSRGKRILLAVVGVICGGGLLLCGGCIARLWYYSDPANQITVGPDTTVIDGPLTVDGFIDYESALNQRLVADVTTDNNAVVLLVQAFGPSEIAPAIRPRYFQLLGIAQPNEYGQYFVDMDQYVKKQSPDPSDLGDRLQAMYDAQGAAAIAPWTEADHPDLAALLAQNEAPLALIVEASQRPRYYAPVASGEQPSLMMALLPIEQKQRAGVRLLTARAMLKLGNGDSAGAWEDLLACHRLSRLTGQSWCVIGALVSIALDAVAAKSDEALLASPALTAEQARKCLADLDALGPLPSMADITDVGERYVFLDSVRLMAHGQSGLLDGSGQSAGSSPTGTRNWQSAAVDWNTVMRIGNEHYDATAAAMRLSDPIERSAGLQRLLDALPKQDATPLSLTAVSGFLGDREGAGQNLGERLVALLAPASDQAMTAEERSQTRFQLTRLGFALAVYRREQGKYPETLDPLVPGILPELPNDPCTLAPFIYERTETGYLLYSVGQNRVDDHGVTFDDEPSGDDIRLRIDGP